MNPGKLLVWLALLAAAVPAWGQREVNDRSKVGQWAAWLSALGDQSAAYDQQTATARQQLLAQQTLADNFGPNVAGPTVIPIDPNTLSSQERQFRQALITALNDPKNPDTVMLKQHMAANAEWEKATAVYAVRLNELQERNSHTLSFNERIVLQQQLGVIHNEMLVLIANQNEQRALSDVRETQRRSAAREEQLRTEAINTAVRRVSN
jgi:hypothetical protein